MRLEDIDVEIIHAHSRTDRAGIVGDLRAALPHAKLRPAFVPEGEMRRDTRAILGCSLSHLLAIQESTADWLLMIEDDAYLADLSVLQRHLPPLTKDVGAVLLGAEVKHATPAGDGITADVHQPFYGSHAVLYNVRQLKQTDFLLQAFALAASMPMEDGRWCYEVLLGEAMKRSGLRLVMLQRMLFGTRPSISDRTGVQMASRRVGTEQPLLPYATWEPLLELLRGKKVAVLNPPGNVGDGLIAEGTRLLFDAAGIQMDFYSAIPQHVPPNAHDVYCWAGGGNISGRWRFDEAFKMFATTIHGWGKQIIVLPQSIEEYRPHLDLADVLILREQTSYDIARFRHPRTLLLPDLALANHPTDFGQPTKGPGVYLRDDDESEFKGRGIESLGDPCAGVRSPQEYILKAAQHSENTSDRAHFIVASLLAGRKATLVTNSYHKNRSLYCTWLESLGVSWAVYEPDAATDDEQPTRRDHPADADAPAQ